MTVPTRPDALTDVDPSRILDLDVRGDLRAGNDPFLRIMHARQGLADDGILRLRATFEPRPLYAVMEREGFEHWAECMGDDDWRVWFHRPGPPDAASEHASGVASTAFESPAASGDVPWSAPTPLATCGTPWPDPTALTGVPVPTDVAVLDVRGMEPPEPLTATLGWLESLPDGHTLIQINRRPPHFLFPELERRGFQCSVREEGDEVRVFIRRREEYPVLDVRLLPPHEKHPTIFATFDALAPGAAFVIATDHDPVPLERQFLTDRPHAFEWEIQADGPKLWRVLIRRLA
jgi:uncharacterized protein (DUF2249 family)